ncbi:hypothetical protein [Nocardia sp. SYP-A9097]|uniref:hypothetical protein n=1 Tax=Nocardia sp. SYP-A9097 TaxID=2663237 RepID=UPI001891DBDB|nr:hypothetical protein [Nocardia sp. SYP-A9097]
MFGLVSYPVSAIMLAGHIAFGWMFGRDSGLSWLFAVLLLAVVVRLCLLPISWLQVTSLWRPSGLRATEKPAFPVLPYAAETTVQVLVFAGLWHVLSSFDRTGTGVGQPGMTPYENAHTPNYLFDADEVQSFLTARLFGAPLSVTIGSGTPDLRSFAEYGGMPSTGTIVLLAMPLIVATAVLIALNEWSSPTREFARRKVQPAVALYPICQWMLPILVLVTGAWLPIGVLIYLLGTNLFTMVEHRAWAALSDVRHDIRR